MGARRGFSGALGACALRLCLCFADSDGNLLALRAGEERRGVGGGGGARLSAQQVRQRVRPSQTILILVLCVFRSVDSILVGYAYANLVLVFFFCRGGFERPGG